MIELLSAAWTFVILTASLSSLSLFWFFVYAGSITGVGAQPSEKPGFAFIMSFLLSFALSFFPIFIIDMSIGYYLMDLSILFAGFSATIFLIIEYSRRK
jgi:hypothetical protein